MREKRVEVLMQDADGSHMLRREEAAALALLDALPAELLTLVLTPLSTHDLGWVDQVCHALHSAPSAGELSVLEQALRRRAAAGGLELPLEPTYLEGEASMSQFLMWLERRREWPRAKRAACGMEFSVFVDLHGGVLLSGFGGLSPAYSTDSPLATRGHGETCQSIRLSLVPALQGVRVVSVSAGPRHALAITEAGMLYSWGLGADFRLGHGDNVDQPTPKIIESLQGVRVVQAAAGDSHSVAVLGSGRVVEWGWNGSSCYYKRRPTFCSRLKKVKVVDVSAGVDISLALSEDGRVYEWGKGTDAYRANGPVPMLHEALADVTIVSVSCQAAHCLAVTDQGRVYSWGCGNDGRLGHGTVLKNVHLRQPSLIEALQFEKIVSVTASSYASFAVTDSGKVYSWGDGLTLTLGHGDQQDQCSPKRIENGCERRLPHPFRHQTVVHVAAGFYEAVAVTASGRVYAWGNVIIDPVPRRLLSPHLVHLQL